MLLLLFSFITVKADSIEPNVTFTLVESFFTDVSKSYQNGITIFDLTNNLDTMNLTKEQLKKILKQKPGNGSSRLTYYETLNIKVTPQAGTNFNPLVGKDTYYRGTSGGAWVTTLNNQNISQEPTADLQNLDSNFWPYGFKINYRLSPTGNFTKDIPDNVDLNNKTLEQQLATLLGIDLNSNPNGVVNEYKNLYIFKLLDNYNYLTRMDFYSKKEGTNPIISGGSYEINSLNLLDSYYVAIKYHKTVNTMLEKETQNKLESRSPNLGIIIGLTITIVGGFIYYRRLKCKEIKKLS